MQWSLLKNSIFVLCIPLYWLLVKILWYSNSGSCDLILLKNFICTLKGMINTSIFHCVICSWGICSYMLLLYCLRKSSKGVLWNMCSENMQQIYRRTPMQKYDFNKDAKQKDFLNFWIFKKKDLFKGFWIFKSNLILMLVRIYKNCFNSQDI